MIIGAISERFFTSMYVDELAIYLQNMSSRDSLCMKVFLRPTKLRCRSLSIERGTRDRDSWTIGDGNFVIVSIIVEEPFTFYVTLTSTSACRVNYV